MDTLAVMYIHRCNSIEKFKNLSLEAKVKPSTSILDLCPWIQGESKHTHTKVSLSLFFFPTQHFPFPNLQQLGLLFVGAQSLELKSRQVLLFIAIAHLSKKKIGAMIHASV